MKHRALVCLGSLVGVLFGVACAQGTDNYDYDTNGTPTTSGTGAAPTTTSSTTSSGGGGGAPCGNGTLDSGEGCDDGDTSPGDGCDASCAVEAGYECAGEPSLCCDGGLKPCAGLCVDTDTNDAHCGGCNAPCDPTQACTGGSCEIPSITFAHTGAAQSFTVPAGTTALTVEVLGASGGHTGSYYGGYGASVVSTIPVTAGEVLTIVVGGQPALLGAGMDGCGASGGGGSFVLRSGNVPLVVAGGGGGATGYGVRATNGGNAGTTSAGVASGVIAGGSNGSGGGATSGEGAGGGGYLGNGSNATPAQGGQATANGAAGGANDASESCTSTPGGFGGGGGGGNDFGGGGGGYSGGAAHSNTQDSVRAGGGGSYSIAAGTITVRGVHGNGQITISW